MFTLVQGGIFFHMSTLLEDRGLDTGAITGRLGVQGGAGSTM